MCIIEKIFLHILIHLGIRLMELMMMVIGIEKNMIVMEMEGLIKGSQMSMRMMKVAYKEMLLVFPSHYGM